MSSNSEHKEQQLAQMLTLLADGNYHSGQKIADNVDVSRAYIWKLMQQLQEYGLDIETVAGRGYIWRSPSTLLNDENFSLALSALNISYDYHLVVDSTNQYLKDNFKDKHLVVAEFQTAGRGRRGRAWQSPMATNLYFSYGWKTSLPVQQLGGLSLVIGVSIAETLEKIGFDDLQLKWPNDVRVNQKKLAGVLIELSGDASGDLDVVIGVGLNVNMQSEQSDIGQDWTSLACLRGKPILRQGILLSLLQQLQFNLATFEEKGFNAFQKIWNCYDETVDRSVVIKKPNEELAATARGVDDNGALLIETESGVDSIYVGELSLRLADED